MWSISSLKHLYIAGNSLRGNLASLNLPSIEELGINSNRIYGELPLFFNNKKIRVFDISRNFITGYLHVDISPPDKTAASADPSIYKAEVNRLSGTLLMSSVNKYTDISVLNGNLMSCDTRPAGDIHAISYICETSNLQYSVITWCVIAVVFAICVLSAKYVQFKESNNLQPIAIILKQFVEFSVTQHQSKETVQSKSHKTNQFVYALSRLINGSFFVFVGIFLSTLIIYSSFKVGPGSDDFNTHKTQYLNLISGIFLKNVAPACVLLIVFFFAFCSVVHLFSQYFITDWIRIFSTKASLVASSGNVDRETRSPSIVALKKGRESRSPSDVALQIVLSALFIGISLLVHALYVYSTNVVSEKQLFVIQIFLFLFNTVLRNVGLPALVSFIFRPTDKLHTSRSVFVYASLLVFVDIISPCLATLFADDLCLHNYIEHPDQLRTNYNFNVCHIRNPTTGECLKIDTISNSFSVDSPFIFSGQCRTAVFSKFFPSMLLNCAYSTFLAPLIHTLSTYRITSLYRDFVLWKIKICTIRELVLYDVTYSLVFICEDLALLLLFGIISPFCSVTLWLSVVSRAMLLRWTIYRYCLLQDENCENVKSDIELICDTAQRHVHVFIWQSLMTALYIFAFYLFEIAFDTDNISIVAPICLPSILVPAGQVVRLLFFKNRQSRIDDTRVGTMSSVDIMPSRVEGDNGSVVKNPMSTDIEPREFRKDLDTHEL